MSLMRGRGSTTSAAARASVVFGVNHKDANLVDEAFATMDIQKFVDLLSLDGSLGENQSDDIPAHPWALPPKSVKALAAMQLAVLMSSDQSNVDETIKLGAVPKLVAMIDKTAPMDQIHAAIVALVLLSSTEEGVKGIDSSAVIFELLDIMQDEYMAVGCRAAISTLLVNAACDSKTVAVAFAQRDGPEHIVRLLVILVEDDPVTEDRKVFCNELLENLLELIDVRDASATCSRYLAAIREEVVKQNTKLAPMFKEKYYGTEAEVSYRQLMAKLG